MNAFIYQADIYCEDCGEHIREQRRIGGFAPADPSDESTYDSDEYPKGPYPDGGGEADCPHHCGSGVECINALEFDGRKYGAFLENPLTSDGVEYVREQFSGLTCYHCGDNQPNGPIEQLWAEFYADELSA